LEDFLRFLSLTKLVARNTLVENLSGGICPQVTKIRHCRTKEIANIPNKLKVNKRLD